MYAQTENVDWDLEYLPSKAIKRFPDHPQRFDFVVENFIKIITDETNRVKKKYQVRENVRYGGINDNQLLDIYYKDREHGTPIFVYIHGGYWKIIDKSSSGSFVAPLVERNYRVVAVDYNLCPNVTLEQLTQQTGEFFKWLFKYAEETNATDISFCGHSAGAHLAMYLLNPEITKLPFAKYTNSIFLISGVYDLRELWNLESVNNDNIFSIDEHKAAQLSPILWNYDKELIKFFNTNKIKIHVLVAENDSTSFIGQSHELAKILASVGFDASYKLFENYDHFDIIEEVTNDGSNINRYVLEHLK